MRRFDIEEARSLLRAPSGMPGSPAARPVLASLPALAASLARRAPKPRLLMSVCMTASLMAGLIYASSLPYHHHHPRPSSGAAEAFRGASAAIPPLQPVTDSAASPPALDSDSFPGETIAEDSPAPEPPSITGADIHLAPVLQPGLDMGPVLGRLNIPAWSPPAEGGPYLTVAAMHATSHAVHARPRDLPLAPRRPALAAPLAAYHLESRFGPRRDPFNGNMAFHAGVDLVAPFRSPVYGAAPGIVVFAGVKDAYGRSASPTRCHGRCRRSGHRRP